MSGAVQLGLDGSVATVGARPDDDHYRTPRWLVDAVFDTGDYDDAEPPYSMLLDAGAGDGSLAAVAACRLGSSRIDCVEIDPIRTPARLPWPDRKGWLACNVHVADFLAWAPEQQAAGMRWDFVISNPPFRLWDEFVRAILPLVGPDGTALVLGFVNVLGGQGRAAWWRANPPSRIWLSPRRASFTADGQTDSRDCAWFEWGPGERNAEFRWLETERG